MMGKHKKSEYFHESSGEFEAPQLDETDVMQNDWDKGASSRCGFRDCFHLLTAMKLLIGIGTAIIIVILVLESIYFRRAIFVLLIPILVTLCTVIAIFRQDGRLVWPIVGVSFFHMFFAAYATLVFSFYFFFKPLYIIMVLNWLFDTLHTKKTLSFYLNSLAVFTILISFFLFNLWQLRVSLRFQQFLAIRSLDKHHEKMMKITAKESLSADTTSSSSSTSSGGATSKILNQLPVIYPSSESRKQPARITKQQQLLTASNNNLLAISQNQSSNVFVLSNQIVSGSMSQYYGANNNSNEKTYSRTNSRNNSFNETKRLAI